ncbi:phosphocarrier protein [Anaerosolibacter carboniphilus]|uniref:Phosphocarrier protein n=1 Tax=Anaerosolibacter carboniphilus TaxID=1417629 RepID=A0A841L4F4_9FIRM|nr:HPr family phosphocarrier protein [Anaerosolibacter carboniphilus]MBB6219040.1 phosphocarrier protein [Anaerosolibacter carboniphilus]
MYQAKVTVSNALGLHARPAKLLVKEAENYTSDIRIIKSEKEYNVKSMMGILSMGAQKGTELTLVAEGVDEEAAVVAIKKLFDSGFGE